MIIAILLKPFQIMEKDKKPTSSLYVYLLNTKTCYKICNTTIIKQFYL